MNKKKKIIIISIILIIIIIAIFSGVIIYNYVEKKSQENLPIVDISEVMDEEDTTNLNEISTKKSKEKVAEHYDEKAKVTEAKADVKLGSFEGKELYVRGENTNANIFQTKFKVDLNENIAAQVGMFMQDFEIACFVKLGLPTHMEASKKQLHGEAKYDFDLPPEESVFLENRTYTVTYLVEQDGKEVQYDLNYYSNGDYLVCEFAKILD